MGTSNPKPSPFYWYTVPISDEFMWTKLKYHFEGNDVPTGRQLIGPARFSPPVSVTQSQPPYNEDLKLLENVFMTILKNEFGVNSWEGFDKKIGEALGFPVVGEPGSVLEAETRLAQTVDSEKVFKYALNCEYRIKKP
jgi:hypothetical protein